MYESRKIIISKPYDVLLHLLAKNKDAWSTKFIKIHSVNQFGTQQSSRMAPASSGVQSIVLNIAHRWLWWLVVYRV